MHTIPTTAVAMGLAVMCTAGLTAQTQNTKTTTTTKIEIKDGKEITAIGCLTRSSAGDYILTKFTENRLVNPTQYALVSSDDLSKHVGHLVEIQGKTVTAARGKASIESKTRTEGENGKDRESTTKSEGTTGAFEMPFLGVSSTKMLSASCN